MSSESKISMPSNSSCRRRRSAGAHSDFMTYPFPETERVLASVEALPPSVTVTEETKRCISSLLRYRAVRTRARLPRGRSAAVLVPLFVGRSGDLYVVLSRRSDALRAFAGDTALPGGKMDAQDATVEDAARREAFEEVGIPRDKERVPLLCVMEPHWTKGDMLVTPVVVLILDRTLQPNLNSSEVTSIFAQPLVSFLMSTPHLSSGRAADPKNPYHTWTDLPWSGSGMVRLHRFLTGREAEGVKPVFGLTAAILIKTATIGYGRTPEFEVQPANAPTHAQRIAHALLTPTNPLRAACEQEGIDANKAAARLLRPTRRSEWQKMWKKFVDGGDCADLPPEVTKAAPSGSISRPDSFCSCGRGVKKRADEAKKQVQDEICNGGGEGTERIHFAKAEEFKKQALEGTEEIGEEINEHRRVNAIPDPTRLDELDPDALLAMVPKVSLQETGKEGSKRMEEDLEEMKKYIGKDENDPNPRLRKRDAKL